MPPVFSSPVATILLCGASRASIGVFQRAGDRLRCLHFAEEPFPLANAGEENWLERTIAALRALGDGRRWRGPVAIVLPPHLTLIRQLKVPRHAEPAKRAKVVRFEAEQAIPDALGEMAWDWMVSGRRETEEDILLVAAKREIIDQVCQAAQDAGFEPCRVLPSSLATLAAFRLGKPPGQPALVLNIGERSTTLLQVDDARFASRILALGGSAITRQIAENQDCDADEAERIKVSGRNPALVADALQAFVDRLAQEIGRTVLHFAREGGLAHPRQLFLTGGSARLDGLAGALAGRLKIPVESLVVGSAVEPDAGVAAGEDAVPLPADLVGAAAILLRPGQPAVDLLPPARHRRATLRRNQSWLIVAALLLVAAMLPPILHYRQVAVTARAKIAAMEKALAPLRTRAARMRGDLARLEETKACIAQLQAVRVRQAGWLHLFAGLQERLVKVEDAWLEKLQPIPAANGSALKLAVSGCMLDRTEPRGGDGLATAARVKSMLAGLAGLPGVAAIEGERFAPSEAGIVRFDFVLVTDPAHPL